MGMRRNPPERQVCNASGGEPLGGDEGEVPLLNPRAVDGRVESKTHLGLHEADSPGQHQPRLCIAFVLSCDLGTAPKELIVTKVTGPRSVQRSRLAEASLNGRPHQWGRRHTVNAHASQQCI
jgi:hypothetical protein